MDNGTKQNYDLKQLGLGGGSVLAILFLFQSQGIDIMNQASEQAVLANRGRIELLEKQVNELGKKLDNGFDKTNAALRKEITRIVDIVRESSNDRYKRSEHDRYSEKIELRLKSIENRLFLFETKNLRNKE